MEFSIVLNVSNNFLKIELTGTMRMTPEMLLGAADKSMYKAKQNGRNRVEHIAFE